MSIGLLSLPDLLFRRAINCLSILQIVELSLTSTKAAKKVEGALKLGGSRMTKVKVTIGWSEQSIKVYDGMDLFEWKFTDERFKKTIKSDLRTRNRETVTTSYSRGTQFSQIATRLFWLLEKAPKKIKINVNADAHFLDLFKSMVVDSFLIEGTLQQGHEGLWKKFFSYENLILIRSSLHFKVDNTEIMGNLNHLKREFHVDEIILDDIAWLDGYYLHNKLRAKYKRVYNTELDGDSMNFIIKRWMRCEIPLITLEIRPEPWIELEYDDVLKDIEHKEWDREQRAQCFPWIKSALDLSEARDIVRSDGKLASIRVTSDTFFFVVWNNRFPIITNSDFTF